MSSVSKRQALQGYCPSNHRPMCGNCAECRTDLDYCNPGDFPVTSSAWCPVWKPDTDWQAKHPAAYALWLGGRHGPA